MGKGGRVNAFQKLPSIRWFNNYCRMYNRSIWIMSVLFRWFFRLFLPWSFSRPVSFAFFLLFFLLLLLFFLLLVSSSLFRAFSFLFDVILVRSFQSVRIVDLSRWFRPYFHFGLIEAQANCRGVCLCGPFLFPSLDSFQKHLHLRGCQLFFLLFGADSEGGVHSLLVFFHGLASFLLQLLALEVVAFEVPIFLAPFATLVQDTDLCWIPEIHLSVPVWHFPHFLPIEERPATAVAASDGHPDLAVLFLLEVSNDHLWAIIIRGDWWSLSKLYGVKREDIKWIIIYVIVAAIFTIYVSFWHRSHRKWASPYKGDAP